MTLNNERLVHEVNSLETENQMITKSGTAQINTLTATNNDLHRSLSTIGEQNSLLNSKLSEAEKELHLQQSNLEKSKRKIDTLTSQILQSQIIDKQKEGGPPENDQPKIIMPQNERMRFNNKQIRLPDEEMFATLNRELKKNNVTNLTQVLEPQDLDKDGLINQFEFNKGMQSVGYSGQLLQQLHEYFEFNRKYNYIYLKKIQNCLEKSTKINKKLSKYPASLLPQHNLLV